MGFFDAVKTCFLKYVTFSGRASRSEYWWFFLFNLICQIIASILDTLIFGSAIAAVSEAESLTPIGFVVSLVLFLPNLAAAWRRMHDTGRSGLLLLWPTLVGVALLIVSYVVALFVLIAYSLLVIFWLTRPSQPGTNDYGPNPHEVSS
ncbi:MAG: DUF805 domain-containing protein [Rhodobacteraceae bacterium]|nr:DUF805 domain-containing protein [Paracoccaceae bacterium]